MKPDPDPARPAAAGAGSGRSPGTPAAALVVAPLDVLRPDEHDGRLDVLGDRDEGVLKITRRLEGRRREQGRRLGGGVGTTSVSAAPLFFGRLSVDANASPKTKAIATRVPNFNQSRVRTGIAVSSV